MKLSEKITSALSRVSNLRDNGLGLQALWNSNFYEWQNEAMELGEAFSSCFTTASKNFRYDIRNTEPPANFSEILKFIIALLQVAEKTHVPEEMGTKSITMESKDMTFIFRALRDGNMVDITSTYFTQSYQGLVSNKAAKAALELLTNRLAPVLWLKGTSDMASLKIWLTKSHTLLDTCEQAVKVALSKSNSTVDLKTILSLEPSDEAWDELMAFFMTNPLIEMQKKDGREKQWKSMTNMAKTNKTTAFEWFVAFFT